ncbi:uncharacterized protein LOC141841210 isoform X1 [Curcuma longa]|uniref:uncharacterized protein LOC141841210 isoform X1 n=1 Tax=Curcuma longa TaxID=136217 RepID=UPI003D9EBD9D
MESARESRRRRILEHGSERLAFISGQARLVPDSSSSPQDSHTSVAPLTEVDATNYHISEKNGSDNDHNNTSETFESINSARSNEVLVSKTKHDIDAVEPENNDQVKPLQTERDTKPLSTSMPASSSRQVVSTTRMHAKKQMSFSSKQVSRGISASETMRLLCAVIIALLVVMSRRGYTLGSGVASSILSFKPLFLAMFTDVTIILWLLKTTQQEDEKEKEKARTGRDESRSTDDIGETVETILVLLKLATAIFMDCSICAVIIVCGLCF